MTKSHCPLWMMPMGRRILRLFRRYRSDATKALGEAMNVATRARWDCNVGYLMELQCDDKSTTVMCFIGQWKDMWWSMEKIQELRLRRSIRSHNTQMKSVSIIFILHRHFCKFFFFLLEKYTTTKTMVCSAHHCTFTGHRVVAFQKKMFKNAHSLHTNLA